jgi:hypothetical protein
MRTKAYMLLICLFAVAGLALAQAKVDGKWTGEIQGGRGPQMVTLTLKDEGGGKLTGTYEGGRGGATPIEEGKISGTTITFKRKQMGRGGEPVVINYTGTVSGDEIKFKQEVEGGGGGGGRGGGPVEFTVKRAS